ncbi:transglycosylase family protein [Hoeflea sp. IMCC20628]|uniref:transglycosylase SLT domain-containing protein n=1 Tax=Hoeflea sp. IMCC20628 TaxID=1620421 RepID=UPI00063BE180|nr:transglycosylase SLT domain-containing protein [Hoeflea sp. IMCC20628]AKI01347.1 transglycosylase family protein [Hoeflea sp. IMCC20628]
MARLSFFNSLISWLTRRTAPVPDTSSPAASPGPIGAATSRPQMPAADADTNIAWGARVSAPFKHKAITISRRLDMDPNHLMAIMAFETGRTFDPGITNQAGSGATGLIQFMPATAKGLGTTTARLAMMSAIDQLDYVERYLTPYAGRMGDLASAYMAVLYPRAVDKDTSYVLFRKGSTAYKLNRGLDVNRNGQVTKADAAEKVLALLTEGLRPGLIG